MISLKNTSCRFAWARYLHWSSVGQWSRGKSQHLTGAEQGSNTCCGTRKSFRFGAVKSWTFTQFQRAPEGRPRSSALLANAGSILLKLSSIGKTVEH